MYNNNNWFCAWQQEHIIILSQPLLRLMLLLIHLAEYTVFWFNLFVGF